MKGSRASQLHPEKALFKQTTSAPMQVCLRWSRHKAAFYISAAVLSEKENLILCYFWTSRYVYFNDLWFPSCAESWAVTFIVTPHIYKI